MQGVMSGQGAIGFSVAITQFLSALNTASKGSGNSTEGPDDNAHNGLLDGHKLVTSTYHFLIISLLFTFVAGIATYILIKLPCYQHAMERHKQIEESQIQNNGDNTSRHTSVKTQHQQQHHKSSIWQVDRKIRDLGWALAYIYTVSIGLFPSITMSIASVNSGRSYSSVSMEFKYNGRSVIRLI